MKEERPLTREMAKAVVEQLKAAMASGADRADFDLGGQSMQMSRTLDGGYAIGTPGEEAAARMYFAPATRPVDYPAELPFVPGESVTVTETGRGVALMWWAPSDPASLIETLTKESFQAEWRLEEEREIAPLGVTNRVLRKESRERVIIRAQGMVTFIDHTPR